MSSNLQRAIVRAGFLIATEPFISTEQTRYYHLRGIHITHHQAEGACIVATDGHLMSVIHDRDAIIQGEPQIWRFPWKKWLKAPMVEYQRNPLVRSADPKVQVYADLTHQVGKPTAFRLVSAESAADVFNGRGEEIYRRTKTNAELGEWGVIDGTFPEWRRIVPSDRTAENFMPAWFQARYVAKLAAFGQAVAETVSDDGRADRSSPMSVFSTEGGAPGVARFVRDEGFVVIMPVRERTICAESGGLPDWYTMPAKEAPEKVAKPDLRIAA